MCDLMSALSWSELAKGVSGCDYDLDVATQHCASEEQSISAILELEA
jgi:hypothetical protein